MRNLTTTEQKIRIAFIVLFLLSGCNKSGKSEDVGDEVIQSDNTKGGGVSLFAADPMEPNKENFAKVINEVIKEKGCAVDQLSVFQGSNGDFYPWKYRQTIGANPEQFSIDLPYINLGILEKAIESQTEIPMPNGPSRTETMFVITIADKFKEVVTPERRGYGAYIKMCPSDSIVTSIDNFTIPSENGEKETIVSFSWGPGPMSPAGAELAGMLTTPQTGSDQIKLILTNNGWRPQGEFGPAR